MRPTGSQACPGCGFLLDLGASPTIPPHRERGVYGAPVCNWSDCHWPDRRS